MLGISAFMDILISPFEISILRVLSESVPLVFPSATVNNHEAISSLSLFAGSPIMLRPFADE